MGGTTLSLDEVKALDDDDDDCGLYQIYGRHIIFGEDSLLYIAITTSTFNRRFFSGPDPHIDWLEEEGGGLCRSNCGRRLCT